MARPPLPTTVYGLKCLKCGSPIRKCKTVKQIAEGRGRYCSRVCAFASKTKVPFRERFERHVVKRRGCWGWTASVYRNGYAMFNGNCAHIASWEIHNGRKVPEGLCVCHSCDNRICTNPDHLFLGTVQDNTDDKVAKGRQTKGSKCWKAKLTEDDVRAIRVKRDGGQTARSLAAEYDVHENVIFAIVSRRTWRHVT